MVPKALSTRAPYVDVVAAMEEQPRNRAVTLKVVEAGKSRPAAVESDPFAEIEV
jgi:hypothetical protein